MPINYDEVFGNKKKRKAEPPPPPPEPPKPEPRGDLVPLDLALVKPGFLTFETEISKWEETALALKVDSDTTRKMAVEVGGEAARLLRKVTGKRDDIWRPHLDFRKKLDAFVSSFSDRLEKVVASMKGKERVYLSALEMQRREAEKLANEELNKLQAKLNQEAAAKKIEPVILERPVIPAPQTKTRTETGVTSYEAKTWKGVVKEGEDDKVARNLCSPDSKKIKEAVGGGLREGMPGSEGLHIYEDVGQRYIT